MAGGGTYTVQAGDSWFKISGNLFGGNQRLAEQIRIANPGVTGLFPGQTIKIPTVDLGQANLPGGRGLAVSPDFMAQSIRDQITLNKAAGRPDPRLAGQPFAQGIADFASQVSEGQFGLDAFGQQRLLGAIGFGAGAPTGVGADTATALTASAQSAARAAEEQRDVARAGEISAEERSFETFLGRGAEFQAGQGTLSERLLAAGAQALTGPPPPTGEASPFGSAAAFGLGGILAEAFTPAGGAEAPSQLPPQEAIDFALTELGFREEDVQVGAEEVAAVADRATTNLNLSPSQSQAFAAQVADVVETTGDSLIDVEQQLTESRAIWELDGQGDFFLGSWLEELDIGGEDDLLEGWVGTPTNGGNTIWRLEEQPGTDLGPTSGFGEVDPFFRPRFFSLAESGVAPARAPRASFMGRRLPRGTAIHSATFPARFNWNIGFG